MTDKIALTPKTHTRFLNTSYSKHHADRERGPYFEIDPVDDLADPTAAVAPNADLVAWSRLGSAFAAWWETHLGFQWGQRAFSHSLIHWVNHGLLTVFFFVVGLEIKREFTVGHLATFRSGALPVIAALGGIILPAVIYASIAPPEPCGLS